MIMPKPSRDNGLSLLQNNPSRDLLLEKMRSKLATTPSTAQAETERKREVRRRATASWTVRGLALAGLIALNYFVFGHREEIAAKLQRHAVPSLPAPSAAASPDEQALYYVYALFDYPKLGARFGVTGFYAVDQAAAKRRVEDLLPRVSMKTLGEISRYMPVAFRSADAGGFR
jgi:hypothetical protein